PRQGRAGQPAAGVSRPELLRRARGGSSQRDRRVASESLSSFIEPSYDGGMRVASLLAPDVEEILRTDPALVAGLVEELHPVDLADLLAALDDELAVRMLAALPLEAA